MHKSNKIRIGITMRVTNAVHYQERRDSIAQDWPRYMQQVFPDNQWLLIPNIQEKVTNYVKQWELNAFIITGGDNIGDFPERDNTERCIFEYAVENGYPVIGICRGLQLIYSWMGGKIQQTKEDFHKKHIRNHHEIILKGKKRLVNSFHERSLDLNSLPSELDVISTCTSDGTIEGVQGKKILGLMWHPERHSKINKWEKELIKNFILNNS